jgi:hypothetical protein
MAAARSWPWKGAELRATSSGENDHGGRMRASVKHLASARCESNPLSETKEATLRSAAHDGSGTLKAATRT